MNVVSSIELRGEEFKFDDGRWINDKNEIVPGKLAMELHRKISGKIGERTYNNDIKVDLKRVAKIVSLNSNGGDKIFLDVPYSEKAIARAKGADFDKEQGLWYVESGKNTEIESKIFYNDPSGKELSVSRRENGLDEYSRWYRSKEDLEKIYFDVPVNDVERAAKLGARGVDKTVIKFKGNKENELNKGAKENLFVYKIEQKKIESLSKEWNIINSDKNLNVINSGQWSRVVNKAYAGIRMGDRHNDYPGKVAFNKHEYKDLNNSGRLEVRVNGDTVIDGIKGKLQENENGGFEFKPNNYKDVVKNYADVLTDSMRELGDKLVAEGSVKLIGLNEHQLNRIKENLYKNEMNVKVESVKLVNSKILSI